MSEPSLSLIRVTAEPLIASEIASAGAETLRAYLHGAALGDGTFSARHQTVRISQLGTEWPSVLATAIERIGYKAWTYREGGSRRVWVVETRAPLLEAQPINGGPAVERAFVRGWFDAEGGIPRNPAARMYIQLVQKNREQLAALVEILDRHGIPSGKIHNPSSLVDPDYWRFFVATRGHSRFMELISSWHPRKRSLLEDRLSPRSV